MNLWHDISRGEKEKLNVVVEIPMLSRVKYELDKETGLIKFDRVLFSPMHYPTNYGFVPQTLWDDGDPLDVFVLGYEALVPGCLIEVRPIGMLPMTDNGEDDVKILSAPVNDPRFKSTADIGDLEPHMLEEIKHFLQVYKQLQKKEVVLGEWADRDAALKAVERSFVQYEKKYRK